MALGACRTRLAWPADARHVLHVMRILLHHASPVDISRVPDARQQ